MFAVLSDPAIYEFENEPPPSAEWLIQRYAKLESRTSADGTEEWLNWVIRLPSGELAGYVQATVFQSGAALVAYELASRHWRKGIGRSALSAVLDELEKNHGTTLVGAVLKSANFRSEALLVSVGFEPASGEQAAQFGAGAGEKAMVILLHAPLAKPPPHKTAMRAAPIEFKTPRLGLVAWQDRHRAPFAEMNRDRQVMRYFPALLTAEQTDAGIDVWKTQFAEKGWSNWAVELLDSGEFIGFIGLSVPRRQLPFSPCTEIGWRLKPSAWGHGYATEGATACLRVGFESLGLEEIVSFTTLANLPSIAVMQRIGMTNTHRDFEHPGVPEGSPLRPHCLYKITRAQWQEK